VSARRIVTALLASLTSLLAFGVLTSPWDVVVAVLVTGLGTLYQVPATDQRNKGDQPWKS
jgi:hypothetical protein